MSRDLEILEQRNDEYDLRAVIRAMPWRPSVQVMEHSDDLVLEWVVPLQLWMGGAMVIVRVGCGANGEECCVRVDCEWGSWGGVRGSSMLSGDHAW